MSKGNRITSLKAKLFNVPLKEPIQDANHGLQTYFELVTVEMQTSDGTEGQGYTYTVGTGGSSIKAMIEDDLAPIVIGADPDSIDQLYDRMQAHMHWVGRGGVVSFAIAAIDVALWDIRGKTSGLPLWKMAGGCSNSPNTYRGGVDLNFPIPKLLESIDGYLAEGFKAIKIKVGKPDLAEDVARLTAVREKLGMDFTLMVDANFGFDLDRAIKVAKAFEPFKLTWLEEPMHPDEFAAYGELASQTTTPLAMGENLHTQREF